MAKEPRTDQTMRSTVDDYEWISPTNDAGELLDGIRIKYMAQDPEDKGCYTRLVTFKPGFSTEMLWTGENKNQNHDFWEEILVLEGTIIDHGTGKSFPKGYYGLRSPGADHGPYSTEIGSTVLETTWRDKAWYAEQLLKEKDK